LDNNFEKTIFKIKEFEKKYSLDSETFYRKYLFGETDELRITDLEAVEWAGEIDIALHWISKNQEQENEFVTH
jgi:hypothetical protein